MRKIITRFKVKDFEQVAPISSYFGLPPAFRFKTTSTTLVQVKKSIESAYTTFLRDLACKYNSGEVGRIFGIRNRNQEQNIKQSFMSTVKIDKSGDFMDKNIYFASV